MILAAMVWAKWDRFLFPASFPFRPCPPSYPFSLFAAPFIPPPLLFSSQKWWQLYRRVHQDNTHSQFFAINFLAWLPLQSLAVNQDDGKGGLSLRGVAFMTVFGGLTVLAVLENTLPSFCLSYKIQHQEATVTVLTVLAVVAVSVVTATPLKLNPPFSVILSEQKNFFFSANFGRWKNF